LRRVGEERPRVESVDGVEVGAEVANAVPALEARLADDDRVAGLRAHDGDLRHRPSVTGEPRQATM
jgi:hypothetical protein